MVQKLSYLMVEALKFTQEDKKILFIIKNLNYPIVLVLAHELTDGNLNNKWNIFHNAMFFLKSFL